jgi:hypothetical protein
VSLTPAVSGGFTFGRVAVGALLTYAQSWFAEGVTLGQLLHSLALAPGEATRIAVIDWSRRTSAFSSEAIAEEEQLDNTSTHARALSEVQNAVASEMQEGSSMTSGWSASRSTAMAESGGSGLIQGALGSSFSGSFTEQEASTRFRTSSTSWSQGTRSVTANLEQHVNDRTEQHATSVRNRRASAVREVSQSEHEAVSTRIVANYNHMHALTVQYFEVVQLYRTLTRLHKADRTLFVPLEYPDFSAPDALDLVQRFRAPLLGGALTARARDLLLDESTSVTIHPVRPPGIVVGPGGVVVATTATTATMATAATARGRLRPVDAARAAAVVRDHRSASARADGGDDDAGSGSGSGTADAASSAASAAAASSAWSFEPDIVTRAVHLTGHLIQRPGSSVLRLPEEALLVGIEVEGIDAKQVRVERPGLRAADTTVDVAEGASGVELFPGVPFTEITGMRLSKREREPAQGSLRLRCTLYGREFETPRLAVSLGRGTSLTRVARVESDRADRQVELLEHLQANREHYGRAIFQSLDTATIVGLLAPFTWRGRPLVELIEPTPLAVAGNFLVFRAPVDDDQDSGVEGKTWSRLLEDLGVGSRDDERLLPIPTGGVFAEAVLGRSNSAEKLDITRFWNWQDSPPPLTPPEIAPVGTGTRGTTEDLRPGSLGAPVLNITNPTALPDPTGLSAVLTAIASGSMFRDMSGLQGTQSLAQAAMAGTLDAATAAGQMANETVRAEIQRQIAQFQAAADVAKAALGAPAGQDEKKNVSAEGARINQGKSLDDRGKGVKPPAGSGGKDGAAPTDGGGAAPTEGGGTPQPSGDMMPLSREALYTDQGVHGFSPERVGHLLESIGARPAVFMAGGGGSPAPAAGQSTTRPQSVQDFETMLKTTLFPNDAVIQKVAVEELTSGIHFSGLFTVGFAAWTNSATKVFVRDFAGVPADQLREVHAIIAFHEAIHVRQFAKHGGRPKNYAQMMDFEVEAYGDTTTWLGSAQAKALVKDENRRKASRSEHQIYAKAFKDEVARVKKLPKSEHEKQFKAFLLGANTIRKAHRDAGLTNEQGDGEPMLPPHTSLGQLYGP